MKIQYKPQLIKANMEEVLIQSTSYLYNEAKNWYPKAHKFAADFAVEYDISIVITSGLIACLSPQKNWFHNLELTEEFLQSEGTYCRHTGSQVDKARRIYAQKDDKQRNILTILGGLKTQNFFLNIYNPKDDWAVTIDNHMIGAMTGDFNNKVVTNKQYNFLKDCLIDYAKELNMLPNVLQSYIWLTVKEIKKDIKKHRSNLLV
jgi:hypothetical protein